MAAESARSDSEDFFNDILVLDGGSTEALAYHIGFVSALIVTRRLHKLRHVVGTGFSAVLAWRLAHTWSTIQTIFSDATPASERNDRLLKCLSAPISAMLLDPSPKWRLHLEQMARDHTDTPTHDDSDNKEDRKTEAAAAVEESFDLIEPVRLTLARARPDGPALWVVRNCSSLDCVLAAMDLGNYATTASFGVYPNIFQAARTECTISGAGLRFIINTKTMPSTPNTHTLSVTGTDMIVYPMHFQVAESATGLSTTIMTPSRLQELRSMGRETVVAVSVTATDKKANFTLAATPRRRKKQKNQPPPLPLSSIATSGDNEAGGGGDDDDDEEHGASDLLSRRPKRCAAPCSGLFDLFSSSSVVIVRTQK